MNGCLVKTLFLAIPILFLALGIWLIIQAIGFWVQVDADPLSNPIPLEFDQPVPVKAMAFVPTALKPELLPVDLEVVVELTGDPKTTATIVNGVFDSECDYLRLSPISRVLRFGPTATPEQSMLTQIDARSVRPPSNCEVKIKLETQGSVAETSAIITIDTSSGHIRAAIKALGGLLIALAGILGSIVSIMSKL